MENLNIEDIQHIHEAFMNDECLDDKIRNTKCLKLLRILLNLKNSRIINKQCDKMILHLLPIYQEDSDNLPLQCGVLKLALSVIENEDEEIENMIVYINRQINHSNNIILPTSLKVASILKEILVFCSIRNKNIFKINFPIFIHKFILQNLVHKGSPTRIFILTHLLDNYLNSLGEETQVDIVTDLFFHCKNNNALDIMCTVCSYVNVQTLLMSYQKSILYTFEFWEYLGNSITSSDSNLQKQAAFLLEKLVDCYYDNISSFNIPFLNINDTLVEEPKKIWEIFFLLLESSKEKQSHLVIPSLKLLCRVKDLNSLWLITIYKILLNHSQDSVVTFIINNILQENVIVPELFPYMLSAINRSDSFNASSNTFNKLPLFCNSLEDEDFSTFLNDVIKITWTPSALWYLFSGLFCVKLEKQIPLIFFDPIYKRLLGTPHIYIRNACVKVFVTHFLHKYEWKDSADDILKMLLILRDYDAVLFKNTVISHIDIHFIDNLKQLEWIKNGDDVLLEVFVRIIKILKLPETLNSLVEDVKKIDNELLTIVYANHFDYFCNTDMENIVEKTDNLSRFAIDNVLVIVNNLMKHSSFNEKMYGKVIDVLSAPSKYNRNELYVSLYIAINFFTTCDIIRNIVNKWGSNDFFTRNKFGEDILILFCELYFLKAEKCDFIFLENLCNSQSDFVISRVFFKFSTIRAPNKFGEAVKFLEIVMELLPSLTKSKYFKTIAKSYIVINNLCLSVMNWWKLTSGEDKVNLIRRSMDILLQFTDVYPSVNYYLSTGIKNLTQKFDYENNCSNILIPAIVELLLKGTVIKKEERVEYMVCQDIYKKLGKGEDNPNLTKLVTRLSSLESMVNIITKRKEFADEFASRLIEKYKQHFNKRYFPDSQIHLQKLRIIQTLLVIHSCVTSQRQPLIDLFMESFCVEIHQPCVKQLIQWLLFFLLRDRDDAVPLLADKIKSTTKTQPSTVAAFIMVLLHVTFTKSELVWSSTIEALLPWCMGPHFKLRVYSQVAVKTLLIEAEKRSYQDFLLKYSFLAKSVNFIIEASGHALQDTLKADELIFTTFDSEREYSLQTILIDIPRLNGVMGSEFENISYYQFGSHKHLPIINEDPTFANIISNSRNIEKNNEISCEVVSENNFNIQRKITPWKISMEEPENDKQLGDFIVIASLIDKPPNLGGLSRTCEVFGIKQLVLNDAKITKDKNFKGLSMTSENWVECVEVKISDLKEFIFDLREKGYCIVGAEQTSDSISLNKYKFEKRTALLLGNEKEGIPPDLIPILDACVEIPQMGLVRSLNVHVAGATFIWEYAKQHLI